MEATYSGDEQSNKLYDKNLHKISHLGKLNRKFCRIESFKSPLEGVSVLRCSDVQWQVVQVQCLGNCSVKVL